VKEKSDKEHFPPLFRVDLPSFFASAATLGFLGVFRVLTKVFFCMAGSSRVLNWPGFALFLRRKRAKPLSIQLQY
jgi:hypothetical protein